MVVHAMNVRRAGGRAQGVSWTQLETGDADRHVHAGLAFEAHRLQRKRIVRAADQRIGVSADAEGSAGGQACVISRQIAGRNLPGRGEHRPFQRRLLRDPDVDADPLQQAEVAVLHALAGEDAQQLMGRTDNEARRAGAAAVEDAGADAPLRGGARGGYGQRGERDGAGDRGTFRPVGSFTTVRSEEADGVSACPGAIDDKCDRMKAEV
jgi:hypothetical protein